jgi:hypothetical protein
MSNRAYRLDALRFLLASTFMVLGIVTVAEDATIDDTLKTSATYLFSKGKR